MKNITLLLLLVAVIAFAFYKLGVKNGSVETKTEIIQNVGVVKQIAELASLQVSGVTNLKVTNKTGDGTWEKFKGYFTENTMMLSLPFDAKYGVDLSQEQMKVDTKSGKVKIYLPACKLLSMQWRLDKMQTMSQTGVFASATMNDFVKAQKQLYDQAFSGLQTNSGYIKLAQENIRSILSRYFQPLGYEVECVFGSKNTDPKE